MSITSYVDITAGNLTAHREALTQQPLSVAMDGYFKDFIYYSSGILDRVKCSQTLNHAVTLVGYGTADDGREYFIGKNSWGTQWGESGYFKIATR